jgi:hypothetical protein
MRIPFAAINPLKQGNPASLTIYRCTAPIQTAKHPQKQLLWFKNIPLRAQAQNNDARRASGAPQDQTQVCK